MRALFAGGVMIALVVTGTVAVAQSLAEVARQEAARRKAIKSSGKVYTNDSLRPEPPGKAPAPPAAPEAQLPPTQAAAADVTTTPAPRVVTPDDVKKDEAYWRMRIQGARDALGRAEIFAEALQTRINALSTDFVNRDDPAQRGVIAASRDKALAELARVKQEIKDHREAIGDVEEEARRAGVPPGWLR